MTPKVLKALKASIRKWDRIALGKEGSNGMHGCPLCELFAIGRSKSAECHGCPVFKITGKKDCADTPFSDFRATFDNAPRPWIPVYENQKEAARVERNFLRALLFR